MGFKLAIDMCYFYQIHKGGKDEVAYNLLRGFDELGVSDQIVCFTYKKLAPVIAMLNPNLTICIVPKIRTAGHFERIHLWFRSHYEEKWALKHNVEIILMPNKPTANRKYKLPTVLIPHDTSVYEGVCSTDLTERQVRIQKEQIRNDFRNRDYIIAISDYDRQTMIKFFPWAKDKVIRIYNPIRFKEAKTNRNEKKYITALNIQWLHKNTKTIIEAFAQIAKSVSYDLILVGRQPENINELRELVNNYKLEDRVFFPGFVSEEELDEIIERTRVFVNASEYEGFGMAAIEMMGRKIPTIVAAVAAVPEVTMGLCRSYFPPQDSDALAKEILDEINVPTSEGELDTISRTVKEKYSYKTIAKEYWDFITDHVV